MKRAWNINNEHKQTLMVLIKSKTLKFKMQKIKM